MKATAPSLTQLEYLVAAVEHGSWSAASEALGVSASAFAQGVSELEKRLGVQLFDKVGRRRVPTADATEAVDYAKRIVGEVDAMQRWAAQSRSGDIGQIRAGMIDTAAVHHFPDVLVRFRTLHPDVSVRLTVRPSGQLYEMLSLGELDVIIAVIPHGLEGALEGLETRPLVSEPIYVYAPPSVTVGNPSTWGPWVSFPAESRTRSLAAQAIQSLGAAFEVVAETSQPAVLREMVRLGMGWTVLAAVDAESEPHALRRAVDGPIAERVLTLARRIDRTPSVALQRFIAMLVSEATIEDVSG